MFEPFLNYKSEKCGINFIKRNESYTSKCSALDLEKVEKHETYLGKRIKRGMFKTSNGFKLNADVNGSYNILRKEIGDGFLKISSNIGLVVSPVRVTLLQN